MKNRTSSEAQNNSPISGRFSLDSGWLFHLGDIAFPKITGHGPTYSNAKAGKAWGAADPEFDDTDWRNLNLPHDWVVEGPFDEGENLSQGYRPRGIAWYRRHFRLDEADRGKHIALQSDGISTHATVWVNGLVVHRSFCGYTPFEVDLTPIVNFGEQINTIAVRVDADAMEGWWYEGGGIYRHTWLVKREPVHIQTYGLYAVPVRGADGAWSIPVEVDLESIETTASQVEVEVELLAPDGSLVCSCQSVTEVPALNSIQLKIPLSVPGEPNLWSVDSPVLYSVRAILRRGGATLDQTSVACGFRTIRFDADEGFFLNDKPLKIQGTCNHQDHAGVGVAVPDSLWDFRVRRLKEMGSNAYRAAHNPPAPEFLDACDRLGMLVMDENRHFNHTPEYLSQLRTMVRRDRNHPSIILWSVFNEEPMQGTAQGREMVLRMAAEVRRSDATRPVTAAMNGGMGGSEGVFEAVDVMGFNYCDHSYDSFHARHPRLPMLSSEDTCTFMTRGEFETDVSRNVISSYDEDFAAWGRSHREAWRVIAERPFLAGGFVGPASTIGASHSDSSGPPCRLSSGSWMSAVFPKPPISFIRPIGFTTVRCWKSNLTGIGKAARGKRCGSSS
jgi:beta-galactosidase